MSLKKYNEKRDFKQTAEPKGKQKSSDKELIFVVQKHDASHLHYDFRLELNGVLLSWAIPKGPSLNPDDKRLAVLVEDHPYDYKDFEGTIPKGNYGAGTVIVWDNGTYLPTKLKDGEDIKKVLETQFKKGHLSFTLNGNKLQGAFSLLQLKGKGENNWLLIKKDDEFASKKDVLLQDKSVISKFSLLEMESDFDEKESDEKPSGNNSQKEIKFQKPMLATTAEKAFDDPNWIFENKYDGYRTIAVVNNSKANLYSRNENSFDKDFKAIADELKDLKHNAVLDGEIVLEDKEGNHSFQKLQHFAKEQTGTLKYYVFDLQNLDGNDTTNLPLLNRKELLEMLFAKQSFKNIIYSPHVKEKGLQRLKQAEKEKSEGIIAKKSDSVYQVGKRSSDWLKIKLIEQEEAIIIGFTAPSGSRKHFGALLLAQYHDKELQFVGKCGTGFSDKQLLDLSKKMNSLIRKTSPLKKSTKLRDEITWLSPKLVGQIKFTEWTENGHLRHPVFLGLRSDKNADEVIKDEGNGSKIDDVEEKSRGEKKSAIPDDYDLKVGKVNLHLTNQNKIYFPKSKISKGEIVDYYKFVAPLILPYLKDRPQSLNRFPNGIEGQTFYQKNFEQEKMPSWLKTEELHSESTDSKINYLLCNNKETLIYMANLGCIEINPWNSTVKNIDNPDWIVIDIDPELDDFKKVVEVALTVKDIMDEVNTSCYCKTSGASGLHIYIPLNAKYNYETAKIFANLIAIEVQARLPKTTTLERSIKKRNHKIYIDYLQNRKGQTIAAPYCVRPKPNATVSTPLEWDEVNADLAPQIFNIKTVVDRFEKKGDLWQNVLKEEADIPKIIEKLS